jgi:hypothetical protein
MKILLFTSPPERAVAALVAHFSMDTSLANADFGGDFPTRVLCAPEEEFPASLHYMFFPRGAKQQFHWHPGGRHLLVLGDSDLHIRSNTCDADTDPNQGCVLDIIPAYTLAIIRFPARTWHEFSAPSEHGTGVVAFSFHDTDDLISTSPTLMEELTTFWKDNRALEGSTDAT